MWIVKSLKNFYEINFLEAATLWFGHIRIVPQCVKNKAKRSDFEDQVIDLFDRKKKNLQFAFSEKYGAIVSPTTL